MRLACSSVSPSSIVCRSANASTVSCRIVALSLISSSLRGKRFVASMSFFPPGKRRRTDKRDVRGDSAGLRSLYPRAMAVLGLKHALGASGGAPDAWHVTRDQLAVRFRILECVHARPRLGDLRMIWTLPRPRRLAHQSADARSTGCRSEGAPHRNAKQSEVAHSI